MDCPRYTNKTFPCSQFSHLYIPKLIGFRNIWVRSFLLSLGSQNNVYVNLMISLVSFSLRHSRAQILLSLDAVALFTNNREWQERDCNLMTHTRLYISVGRGDSEALGILSYCDLLFFVSSTNRLLKQLWATQCL